MTVDKISKDPLFLKTCIYQTLKENPLGFIDVGSMEAIHPIIAPISSLTHVLCFEPNTDEEQKLTQKYLKHPYGELTISNSAIFNHNRTEQNLYITKNIVGSSLLTPNQGLIERYKLNGLTIARSEKVRTETLDQVCSRTDLNAKRSGEFLKIDAQGTAYEVLTGATMLLAKNCQAIWCEVEFVDIYSGQKNISEIIDLLKKYGFCLFGLYPHYLSNRMLDRKKYQTEERIPWADTLFFKDPLDDSNKNQQFKSRDINILIVVAIITKYYDYALELTYKYIDDRNDRWQIEKFIKHISKIDQATLLEGVESLSLACRNDPENAYLHIQKFISLHKSHSNLDFLYKSKE